MGSDAFVDNQTLAALAAAGALAMACAALSVFVVARRWAFIGEGIGHSGFGGAGAAWLLALAFPALDRPWVPYVAVVLFCLATAIGIGLVTRGRRVNADAAIGIFLVASLAWGFLASSVYMHVKNGIQPVGFNEYLFGDVRGVSTEYATAVIALSAVIGAMLVMLNKEIVYYCFDPAMAEASGVRAGLVHYLLMILVALAIVLGARIVGIVLGTALLVLPGTTAMLVGERLRNVIALAIALGLTAAIAGQLINHAVPFFPTGPSIVLVLFVEFLLAYVWARVRRTA